MQIGLEIKVVGGGWHFQMKSFDEFPFLSVSRYKPDCLHQLARSVWGKKSRLSRFSEFNKYVSRGLWSYQRRFVVLCSSEGWKYPVGKERGVMGLPKGLPWTGVMGRAPNKEPAHMLIIWTAPHKVMKFHVLWDSLGTSALGKSTPRQWSSRRDRWCWKFLFGKFLMSIRGSTGRTPAS